MRFMLFNIAVAISLVYLFKGGELPMADIKAQLLRAKAEITQLAMPDAPRQMPKDTAKDTTKSAPKLELAQKGDGHGHDVIKEPAPKPQPQPKPKPKSSTNAAPEQAPTLPAAKEIAARPEPKRAPKGEAPGETKGIAAEPATASRLPTVPPVPPAPPPPASRAADPVAKRRAEVLAEGAPAKAALPHRPIAIKAGTSLMSASERKRELDALADEMELLFIEKVGG